MSVYDSNLESTVIIYSLILKFTKTFYTLEQLKETNRSNRHLKERVEKNKLNTKNMFHQHFSEQREI